MVETGSDNIGMVVNGILGVIVIVSAVWLWCIISPKLKILETIPEAMIDARLQKSAEVFYQRVLRAEAFFRDGKYKEIILRLIAAIFHRLHRFFLAVDRMVLQQLERVNQRRINVKTRIERTQSAFGERRLPEPDTHESPLQKIQLRDITKKEHPPE